MTAKDIIDTYISFFEERGHKKIENSPLVLQNDPTTLFTSAGMQPLVPYLLGKEHPEGKRLVNVQNCFRAQDIDEVGDNRHTTFFRMLGNWSLGDYFKKEEVSWFWEFLTQKLTIPKERLYITVFKGTNEIPKDEEAEQVWKEIILQEGMNPKERILYYGTKKNWWSRSGVPENMPAGEPGGPDTEVFYRFNIEHNPAFGDVCHPNCDCGRFMEIANSVFMQYVKQENGSFKELPKKNVDFGGGLERLLAAVENMQDVFQTSLFAPIVAGISHAINKPYSEESKEIRIIAYHFISACFIAANDVIPSNKEQGYILRRLIRRGLDSFYQLQGGNLSEIIETIVDQYKNTDQILLTKFEHIKNTILAEENSYSQTRRNARKLITRKYPSASHSARVQAEGLGQARIGDELKGQVEISTEDAFVLYTAHGLSPAQIKSLGFLFNEDEFVQKMKEHQQRSKMSGTKKFDRVKEIR